MIEKELNVANLNTVFFNFNDKKVPLSVKTNREEKESRHINEICTLFDSLFYSIEMQSESTKLSLSKLAKTAGYAKSDLKKLEEIGLVSPQKNRPNQGYDDIDRNIVKIVLTLSKWKLTQADLRSCKRYIEAIRIGARIMYRKNYQLHDSEILSLTKLMEKLTFLKIYFMLKFYRQELERSYASQNKVFP